MIRTAYRHRIFLGAALTLLWPVAAPANPNEAQADRLYRDAMTLMERGNFEQACPKLQQSQSLDPAVGTLLYLGECYAHLGKTGSALVTFLAAADAARRANQLDRELVAKERAAQLGKQTPTLTIVVPADADALELAVTLDGIPVAKTSWGTAIPVDPGDHTIAASAPRRKAWSAKLRIDSKSANSTMTLPQLIEAAPPAGSESTGTRRSAAVDGPDPRHSTIDRHGVGLALAGVGAVGLSVGAIFGIRARSKEKDSEAYCWPDNKSHCSREGIELLNEGRTAATWANIGLLSGTIALAGGIALYFFPDEPASSGATKRAPQLHLSATPRHLVLEGSF